MSDLSITAASVAPGSGVTIQRGIAGASITAGMSLFLNSSNQLVGAKADTLTDAACVGIALNNAASGQPVNYASGGNLNLGATLAVGTIYIVSPANAGGIAPIGDATTGTFLTVLGVGTTTSNLQMNLWPTGVDHA